MATIFEISERLNSGEKLIMKSSFIGVFMEQSILHRINTTDDRISIKPHSRKGYSTIQLVKFEIKTGN